jgi:hypothetical protein
MSHRCLLQTQVTQHQFARKSDIKRAHFVAYVANCRVAALDYIYPDGVSTERDEGYLNETWKWMRTGKTKTSKSGLYILLSDQ